MKTPTLVLCAALGASTATPSAETERARDRASSSAAPCDLALVTHTLEDAWQHYFSETSRDAASKAAFLARLEEADTACGRLPDLLELKAKYLNWVDEGKAAAALLADLRDDEVTDAMVFGNRLRARYRTEPAAALRMLRRALDGQHPDLLRKAVEWIHDGLAQHYAPVIEEGVQSPAHEAFFGALADPACPALAAATAGLRLWVEAVHAAAQPSRLRAMAEQSWSIQDPDACGPRYRLLIADLLARDPRLRTDAVAVRERVARELGERPAGELPRRERYWLAYAHYAQGRALVAQERSRAVAELRMAAETAQVMADQNETGEASYESAALGAPKDVRSAAAAALEDAGALADALDLEIGLALHAASHLSAVRRLHAALHPGEPFDAFWATSLDSRLSMAPAFDLPGVDGTRLRLESLRGRWVLLDFWGTWCGPCVEEMPKLQALFDHVKTSERAAIVTIAAERSEDPGAVLRVFLAKTRYTLPVLIADGSIEQRYGIDQHPSKRLVTPTGRLIQLWDVEWEETFRAYALGEDAPPSAATR